MAGSLKGSAGRVYFCPKMLASPWPTVRILVFWSSVRSGWIVSGAIVSGFWPPLLCGCCCCWKLWGCAWPAHGDSSQSFVPTKQEH